MCHRFNVKQNLKEIAAPFEGIQLLLDSLPETDRYPMSDVPIIRRDAETDDWLIEQRQWGWLPSDWKPSTKYTTRKKYQRERFNARSETVDTTWGFRRAFPSQRCVLVGSGFYEPYISGGEAYFTVDAGVIYFAGLWDHWTNGEESVDSCTMLTTEANPLVAANRTGRLRQPVIFTSPDQVERYCSLEVTERSQLEELMTPLPEHRMEIHRPE
jgi:putative SOS response-associated peptidase YedK